MRTLWRILCCLLLVCTLGAAVHPDHPDFKSWHNCGACEQTRTEAVAAWEKAAREDSPTKALQTLMSRVASHPVEAERETLWRDNLLKRMGYALSQTSAEAVRPGTRFEPFGLQAPDGVGIPELAIDPKEPSPYAREVWTWALGAHKLLVMAGAEDRKKNLLHIQEAKARWDNFQTHAMADQFPWESWFNARRNPGTLTQPPTFQWRGLHPEAAVLLSTRTRVSTPVLAVELAGFRRYDPESFQPTWGLSLFATTRASEQQRETYGLMVSLRDFTLGITAPQRVEGRRESQLLLGLKLSRLIDAKRTDFRQVAARYQKARDSLIQGAGAGDHGQR